MKKSVFKRFLISMLGLAVAVGGVVVPTNTIKAAEVSLAVNNPGFEYLDGNGSPLAWIPFGDSKSVSVSDSNMFNGDRKLIISDSSSEQNAGAESEKVGVTPLDTYIASAEVNVERGTAEIYVRFYDDKGNFIESPNSTVSNPLNQWTKISVSAQAPINAATASVLFYSSKEIIGKFYADNVSLVKNTQDLPQYVTNLGAQIKNTQLIYGVVGKDADGKDVAYSVVTGDPVHPGVFVVVDIKTDQTLKSFPLPGITGAWAVFQASDGRVYLGGYNSPYLYRYTPSNDKIENLGKPIGVSNMIYTISEANDGKIYGGSYRPGHLWEYDPATNKFADLGIPMPGADYVRTTTYNPDANKLYAGTGTIAGVIEYDLNNPNYATDPTAHKNILPKQFQNKQSEDIVYAYDMNYVDGKLFVKKQDTKYTLIVLDTATGNVIEAKNKDTGAVNHNIPATSRGVSPKSPIANKVYFSNLGGDLYSYDLDTNEYETVKDNNGNKVNITSTALDFTYVQLDDPAWPGYTLVGLAGNSGGFYKYNLQTGAAKYEVLNVPAQPTAINNIICGPDGKIYTSGYFSGGVAAYDPSSGASTRVSNDKAGQSEGMTVLGNSIWHGAYPGAKIVEYPIGGKSIERLSLTSDSYGHQDRPFAMLGVEEVNKVFFGTCANYGALDGSFGVYDPVTSTANVYTAATGNSISPAQSIVSLAYKNGQVFIGTSISGGLNSTPTTTEGKLIVWDYATSHKVYETVPVPGARSVQGLTVGFDGNIWGMANGTLFIFNPATHNVLYSKKELAAGSDWRDAFLTVGTDGNVYGTAAGKMFKVDAATKEMTIIISNGVFGLAQDDFGNIYTRNGSDLYKYSNPSIVLKPVGAVIQVSGTAIKRTEALKVSITKAILEKGRATNDLSGAAIEYISSNPAVISIEKGVITGLKVGSADIWAKVTLNGVTVESDKVTITVQEQPLSEVSLSVGNSTLQRNETANLSVAGKAIDGVAADLTGAVIEYISNNPDVVSVENGVATAYNTGSAEVYAKVTLNGQTLQTIPVTIKVTTSIQSIRGLISTYEKSGKINGPMVPQLVNSLEQAEDQLNMGSKDKAIKHMQDFLNHLNNKALQSSATDSVRSILNSDVIALIDTWNIK